MSAEITGIEKHLIEICVILLKTLSSRYKIIYIYIYLARTPEIGQGLGRILSCGARKPEQT